MLQIKILTSRQLIPSKILKFTRTAKSVRTLQRNQSVKDIRNKTVAIRIKLRSWKLSGLALLTMFYF